MTAVRRIEYMQVRRALLDSGHRDAACALCDASPMLAAHGHFVLYGYRCVVVVVTLRTT